MVLGTAYCLLPLLTAGEGEEEGEREEEGDVSNTNNIR